MATPAGNSPEMSLLLISKTSMLVHATMLWDNPPAKLLLFSVLRTCSGGVGASAVSRQCAATGGAGRVVSGSTYMPSIAVRSNEHWMYVVSPYSHEQGSALVSEQFNHVLPLASS